MYGSKTVQYVDQFKSGLRKNARPQSAYIKSGGFSSGMQKTASVTLLPAKAGDAARRTDIFT